MAMTAAAFRIRRGTARRGRAAIRNTSDIDLDAGQRGAFLPERVAELTRVGHGTIRMHGQDLDAHFHCGVINLLAQSSGPPIKTWLIVFVKIAKEGAQPVSREELFQPQIWLVVGQSVQFAGESADKLAPKGGDVCRIEDAPAHEFVDESLVCAELLRGCHVVGWPAGD